MCRAFSVKPSSKQLGEYLSSGVLLDNFRSAPGVDNFAFTNVSFDDTYERVTLNSNWPEANCWITCSCDFIPGYFNGKLRCDFTLDTIGDIRQIGKSRNWDYKYRVVFIPEVSQESVYGWGRKMLGPIIGSFRPGWS